MRLAFSIAINVDADILLIDEILAVGDQHFQEKCFEKLKELRDTDKTIVIVSHSLNTVKELCTRAIWLYKGEFRLDGDPAYVISEYLKQQRDAYKKGEIKKEDLEIHTKAVMFIEKPKSFEMISGDINKIRIEGWEITDNPGAQLKVFVDDVEQNYIFIKPSNDVYETYKDEYPNLDVEEIGWTVDIENNFIEGEHLIKVRLTDIDDIDIVEKEVKFSITKNRRL